MVTTKLFPSPAPCAAVTLLLLGSGCVAAPRPEVAPPISAPHLLQQTDLKPADIPGLWAWWDATSPAGVANVDGVPMTDFARGRVDKVLDGSGNKRDLVRSAYDRAVKGFLSLSPHVALSYAALRLLAGEGDDPRSEERSVLSPKLDLGSAHEG